MNQAFYYVDGIPTKGMWFDLEDITDTDDIRAQLSEAGFCPADYDGDLMVADVEGDIAREFYTSSIDHFDLASYKNCMEDVEDDDLDEGAVAAYLHDRGIEYWSLCGFESSYCGEAESEVAFAEQLLNETGDIDLIPEHLRYYFDYESFARDLFFGGYTYLNGYVFRRN